MFTRYHYTVFALCLVIAIDGMGVGLVWPLFGQLFISPTSALISGDASLHVRNVLYGITLAVFNLALLFGAPLLGDISDHIGRKKILLICLYGTSLGFGICTVAVVIKNVWLLILGRAFLGILAGSQALAQAAIVDISGKQHKMVNLSLLALANELGFIIGPLLGGLLMDKNLVSFFSITTPFIVAILIALANGIFLMLVFQETFTPQKIAQKLQLTKGWNIFMAAFMRRDICLLSIIYLCLNFGFALYFQFMVVYFIQFHHYTGAQIGYLLSSMTVVSAVSFLWLVRLAQRYFSLPQILSYFLLLAAIGVGFTFWQNEVVAWICIIPFGIGTVLAYMAALTLFSEMVAPHEQGWVMGVAAANSAVGWGLSAMVIGLLGAFSVPIVFLLASAVLGLGAVLTWKKVERDFKLKEYFL